MIKTLRISFSLRNTYRVNSILYALRQTPLIRKIIPETAYQMQGFKILAHILSILWECVSVFLGKILYFLLAVMFVVGLFDLPSGMQGRLVLHILVFLSLVGAAVNTYMFNPTRDKYYALILLRMDAREYTLINYFYAILKVIVGFALCCFLLGLPMGLSVGQCLLIPFFVAGIKLGFAAKTLRDYERTGTVENENKLGRIAWIMLLLLLAAAYGLPVLGIMLPEAVSVTVMCICAAGGVISLYKIWTFTAYSAMYKELLTAGDIFIDKAAAPNLLQEQNRKHIDTDTAVVSSRRGFEYLNELFIKRHQKLLWRPVKRIALAALLLTAGILAVFPAVPEARKAVNVLMLEYLPYMVFVMYIINRGTGFTQALYVNCDHCLLTYPFYKQPESILKLFQIRLREIIKINLFPAAVIGGGLACLLYASGGTDNILNYAVLFVSVICMSVFFSVHYLMLYYLLQPYNADTEIKSGVYQLITTATYFVCYMMLQVKMSTLLFGIMTIVFCVVYCIVASILVYRLAPRTFRIQA